ncbi:MAG: NAD(P)H-dependent oxidoreductase [Methylococcales bacterium]|nr:NAD(P)H-dependent oxidoreductase [Methylococcales bacterium]
MKAHIVLAHPDSNSFNGQLVNTTKSKLESAGYDVTCSDLYANNFDPCEGPKHYQKLSSNSERFHTQTEQRFHAENDTTPKDIAAERDKLLQSDLLIIHFPLWWFGMPAILKGWIDRVFIYGSVYRSQMRYDTGICKGKKILACITTGANQDSCSFNGREGDTRLISWPMLFPFRYIGFDVLEPVIFHGVGGVAFIEEQENGLSKINRYINQWEVALNNISSRKITPFNQDTDFDESKRLQPNAQVYSPFISHQSNAPWD